MATIRHRIPNENRQELIDTMDAIQKYLPYPPMQQVEYLFKVYNGFVKNPLYDDEDINCGGCRAKVISQLRFLVNEWKQEQKNLNS